MNYITRSTFIFGLLLSTEMNAQQVPLTLQEVHDAAQRNNQSIIITQLDVAVAQARAKQTQAVYLPQVNLSYSALSTNNPLNTFGFKLQQQSITQNDFDPQLLNHPPATHNFVAKAEVLQPVFNIDMLYMRQAAQAESEAYRFKHERTRQYVVFETERAYAQLQLAHRSVAVLEEAYASIQTVYTATINRYEQGYLQKSDLLQAQVYVTGAESKLMEARSNVRNASDYVSLLMGVKSGVIYSVDTTMQVYRAQVSVALSENRADFLAMQATVDAHEKMMKSTSLALVPKLNVFGEFVFNDANALGFGSDAYLIGAQLSWQIFNGTATKNKIAEQRYTRDKSILELNQQKEQAKLEINKTQRQQHDVQNLVKQQALVVAQSQEAFRLLQNRHAQGLVTTSDLLQAQSLVTQQKLILTQAVFQLNTAQAYLHFLTNSSNP